MNTIQHLQIILYIFQVHLEINGQKNQFAHVISAVVFQCHQQVDVILNKFSISNPIITFLGQNMIFICPLITSNASTSTLTISNLIYISSSYGSKWDLVANNNYTFSTIIYLDSLMSESGKYIIYTISYIIYGSTDSSQATIYISSSYGRSWYY